MKIKEVLSWPPGPWGTSSTGNIVLNPKKAILGRTVEIRGRISLSATENGNSYYTTLKLTDKKMRTSVVEALNSAFGQTVADAGETKIDGETPGHD